MRLFCVAKRRCSIRYIAYKKCNCIVYKAGWWAPMAPLERTHKSKHTS